jgi:hypothetical protein
MLEIKDKRKLPITKNLAEKQNRLEGVFLQSIFTLNCQEGWFSLPGDDKKAK